MKLKKENKFWNSLWEKKSSQSIFSSTGRSYYNEQKLFMHTCVILEKFQNTSNNLSFLDCGGGSGLISWLFYPFFKKIYLIDYSKKLINLAKKKFNKLDKIEIKHLDIRAISKIKNIKFDRVLVGSVLQYLNSYQEIEVFFSDLKSIINPKAVIVFTENPDISKKKNFIKSYIKLNLNKKKLKKALDIEEKRLWLCYKKIKFIAEKKNFKIYKYGYPKNFSFEKKHMFNFVLLN
jgi:ubiquinone/menaquinone biosynthesis C-methylase UbiE